MADTDLFFRGCCVTTKLDGSSPIEILFMFRKVNNDNHDYHALILDPANFDAHVAAILKWVEAWDANTLVSLRYISLLLAVRIELLFQG